MKYIPIRSYDNYIPANMQMALLRESGIDCHIKDEYTITIDPLLSPALGGMKLMVEQENVPKALELLLESDRLYLQTVACPNCKQTSLECITEVTRFQSWAGKIRSLLINGQEQEVKILYRCKDCKHKFRELPQPG